MTQHQFNDNINYRYLSNTNPSNGVCNNCYITDVRSQILTWISPLEPRLRHQHIRERRVANVGEWLLQAEGFRSWYAGSGRSEADNAVLFCYGDPWVGKTYISSLVIDWLCDQAGGQDATVACFYFDFAAQEEQSSMIVLRTLLKQLVGGLEETPEEMLRAYGGQRGAIGGREPGPSEIVTLLQTTALRKRTFICIDALDECVTAHRVKLLDSLKHILQNSPGTRIFVTGRPHIRPEISSRLSGRVTNISITPRRDDTINYLHSRLRDDSNPNAMNSSLKAEILNKIPQEISEIFLLVSLNMDAILRETTIRRRGQRLSAMRDGIGLGDAYRTTLGRIKAQGEERSRLGIAALMWITHSERPLKVDELCHALGVEIGCPNLDVDGVPSIETLLDCCQGLVVVDKEPSTVRLVHFTLQHYLRAHPEHFRTAHSTMAETCLSYLNSQQVKALSASPSCDLQDTPFLEYSSLYWGAHAKRDLTDSTKSLALKLFDDYDNHMSTKILLEIQAHYIGLVRYYEHTGFSGLHSACFFGIAEIVASLVQVEGCDINHTDCTGNTPLTWAALNGHEEAVKILLGRDDVKTDQPDIEGRTPLWWAARNGHEGVLKILLRWGDANPNRTDHGGRTPLSWAAWCGHEGAVRTLLGHDEVSPDRPDNGGRSPLSFAARNGHEGVVKLLLGQGEVSPDRLDNDGRTPLSFAACNGHDGIVRILLGHVGVNPSRPDTGGRTPLSFAACNGHEGVMEMLLGHGDVSPDRPDNGGRTPLGWAAWYGHEGVVKMLLGRGDVNLNRSDNGGRTPLSWAAWCGHLGVARILLGHDDVNPGRPDNGGRTPLSCAACNGHEGVVRMLLGRDDVNPERPDNDGQTPLQWAARGGHGGVIALLRPPSISHPSRGPSRGDITLLTASE